VHDFSCHVEPGQKIAIVGPTGAGKSTLINLLTRFYEVNGGDIKIDGTSIYDMPRETLHSLISMVLQETWTFRGSIRENIVYSKKNVTEQCFNEAIKNCGLDDFIGKCPNGVDTMLAEDADISAGQKQLITIARAMVDDAPILILDEATSSVDTRTEKIISAAIDKLMEGRTSFVIAHRLSTIKNADKILVLKDGDIIEMGTHNELMNKKGFYADLYRSQFDN
jgi:ATP-binding cassette subfamily B protein